MKLVAKEDHQVQFFKSIGDERPSRGGIIPAGTIVEPVNEAWCRLLTRSMSDIPVLFKFDSTKFHQFHADEAN